MAQEDKPLLDAQIEEAQASKGSRLEQLIRDNQDFELLAPEELDDKFPYPLWLRVLWRKQHPEVQMPANNPGGAYPEVLSQLGKRIMANPELPWGDAEAMAAALGNKSEEGKSY